MLKGIVDPGGGGQTKGVWKNKKTLPAGKNLRIHPQDRGELVQLQYPTSEENVLGGLPTEVRQDLRGKLTMLYCIAVHQAMNVILYANIQGHRGQHRYFLGRQFEEDEESISLPHPG